MTDRDLAPHAPSCPFCGKDDHVQREGQSWLCGGCWTLFTGGQGEWERSRQQRERRAQAYRWMTERAEAKEVTA